MPVKHSFSYTEYYEESSPTFTAPPLVCAVEFEDKRAGQIQNIMKLTENAILEWKRQLQQTERYPKDQYIWDIKYTLVTLDKKDTFDFSKCDVVIRFQDKPADSQINCDTLGVTQGISPIEIYIYYRNACDNDLQLIKRAISSTVVHEFGQWMMGPMMQNPQMMSPWMGNMMNDPQLRDQMYSQMMQNNQFMQGMMGNPQFQNQWMGPWMMQNNSTWGGMMGGPMMGKYP